MNPPLINMNFKCMFCMYARTAFHEDTNVKRVHCKCISQWWWPM